MGCASAVMIQTRKFSLPPEVVNSYVDKFPVILLQKIRDKFELLADKDTKDLTNFNFLKLYSVAKLNPEMSKRLFCFFNDQSDHNITFRQFMIKYAILIKAEPALFYKILFQIYKGNSDSELMSEEDFSMLQKNETAYFSQKIDVPIFPLNCEKFVQIMTKAAFKSEEYQSKLTITTEEDIPFQLITKELLECDDNDLICDRDYYLLSNAWYYRWSFYYQEVNPSLQKQQIKSTKMLHEEKEKGRKRKRDSIIQQSSRRLNDSGLGLRSSQIGSSLIQQPSHIEFDDIEGEYRGQLKQNLKIPTQIKIISEKLWMLLSSLHRTEQSFVRSAINSQTLQYYPKAIYLSQADGKGNILVHSQQIKFISASKKLQTLNEIQTSKDSSIFTKNFGQKNWRQIDRKNALAEISLDPRFFIIIVKNKQKFLQKHYRKQISQDNLTLGDKVYAHFTYIRVHAQASIIGVADTDTLKIHFKGYSFRYEIEVNREEVQYDQALAALSSAKKKNQSIIKGISNIGNTCFINSIIECLVATPVLDQFLIDFPFNQKTQPVGYGLAQMAKQLLQNQKPNAFNFKKIVDVHMQIFSGYNQHDAQQFLNLILNKIADELKDKPTVIDYLFGGIAQSKLTCISCNKIKYIEEKMYTLSLPIPEAQFNFYSIIIVPILTNSMKKIIFKLHKSATVGDYATTFEERTGYNRKDYIFCQASSSSLRKMKEQISALAFQKKKITDVGVVPNIPLLAFEKIPMKYYYQILSKKDECSAFKDYQASLSSQTFWTVSKINEDKNSQETIVEYINLDNDIAKIRIDKNKTEEVIIKLGNKTSIMTYKKLILRKYNPTLKKLEYFGIQFLIGVPRWASYNDILEFVQIYIQNLKSANAKCYKKGTKGDYVIRLLDPSKIRCIFCLKEQNLMLNSVDQSDLAPCCDAFDKDVPIAWSAKHRSFWIYVDWIDFSQCNSTFCSYLQIDTLSKNVDNSRQEQQISLEQCIKLHSHSQKVEMECDSCKGKYQNLQHLIGSMPNILVMHMKQFRYTSEGHLIKLDLRLKWQQFFDSSKYSICSQGKIYELYSLVKHSGSSQSGHYTCMAKRKHPFENKKVWINFDDDSTDIIKQEQKYIDDAYLLFFKKVDMPTSSLVIYSDLSVPS